MAKQPNILFLEEWLRSSSGVTGNIQSRQSSSSSARSIIQAWAELRDSLRNQSFHSHHVQCLKTLLDSQVSLHVADPQAKLILSILCLQTVSLPHESYPLLLRLLYIWVRKSFKPSSSLIDSAVEVLTSLVASNIELRKTPFFVSEGAVLLGAITFVQTASEHSKKACLEVLCRLLEEEYCQIGSSEVVISDILAGVGYALSSTVTTHFVRILDFLFGIWGMKDGPPSTVSCGLMLLHLIDWVFSGYLNSNFLEKIEHLSREILETSKVNHVPFAALMAAAGVLRASSRFVLSNSGYQVVSKLKVSAEYRIASIAKDLVSQTGEFTKIYDLEHSLLLKCIPLALARCGPISFHAPVLACLTSALLNEVFPLRHIYDRVRERLSESSAKLGLYEVKGHLEGILFKEAGAITGVLCKYYILADDMNRSAVENSVWNYCQDIYTMHKNVSFWLRGRENELLANIEKIAESVFLMVVVFALEVTKHKFNSELAQDARMAVSVKILVSFSCVEYFRRMRLPEYMDTIRRVIVSVQENESACVSFVESIPSYFDLTKHQGDPNQQNTEHMWSKDEVQTARLLFYLRVIPTCIEQLPSPVFRKVVAPTMFLYMGYPTEKVARASHSLFAAFISAEKASDQDERVLLKEQLVFYYVQRSLELYPGITPFEGMRSGVAALVRHLPAGSPAIYYCIESFVEKANKLCSEVSTWSDIWKNWQGGSEPSKKMLELLLRLISLVDIQVLPNFMKSLAQLIMQLPKDGQNLVLDELYSLVADSDDVTRKPTLVSWLQSLSYLCSQAESGSIKVPSGSDSTSKLSSYLMKWNGINARL